MRPWKAGDEDAFTPRADFAEERQLSTWNWANGAPGPTWSIVDWSGTVLGVGGVVRHEDGRWQAWTWLAEMRRRDWPQLLWLAERALSFAERSHGAAPLVASYREGNPGAGACLARLGFRAREPFRATGRVYVGMERDARWIR